jgi:AmmeMemoRadiSam system protein A
MVQQTSGSRVKFVLSMMACPFGFFGLATQMQHTLSIPAQRALARFVYQDLAATVRQDAWASNGELDLALEQFPEFRQSAGAFVTIYINEHLRGCLGEIEPENPLLITVLRCARRVAVADHRFEPLRSAELDQLRFKISLLSAMEPVEHHVNIEIGRHGLYVRHGTMGGLLLPDVPVQYGWDRLTFLRHLWRKAYIPAHVPLKNVQLYRFTAQNISSEPLLAAGFLSR